MELEKKTPDLSGRKCGLCSSTVDMAMKSSAKAESRTEAASVKGV